MDLVKLEGSQLKITDHGLSLLNRTICKDLSREELMLFAQVCQSKGLDPFSSQIYAIKRSGRITFQTGIDGLRSLAERTGEYDGQEDPVWYDASGSQHYVWTREEAPVACRVGVFRKGCSRPIRAIATFAEFRSSTSQLWRSMPAHLLSKCAEALALRKAFPQAVGGLYEKDEPISENGHEKTGAIEINSIVENLDAPPELPREEIYKLAVEAFMQKCKELEFPANSDRAKELFQNTFKAKSFLDLENFSDSELIEATERIKKI